MTIAENFLKTLSNYCYYDFDTLDDCERCHRKEKCWKETADLIKEEDLEEEL